MNGRYYLGHFGPVPLYAMPEVLFTFLLIAFIAGGVSNFLVICPAVLVTLVLHELGHALVARLTGMHGVEITLGALGGLCTYAGDRRPGKEIAISLAGPAANLLLALAAWLALGHLPVVTSNAVLNAFVSYLLIWNLMFGIFNLLPIYPLDGGQAVLAGGRLAVGNVPGVRSMTLALSVVTAIAAVGLLTWLRNGDMPLFTFFIVGMLLWQAFRDLR